MTNDFRILIADDHSVIRQGISLIVRHLGVSCFVDHACTLSALIEKIVAEKYDLVVLDISIPDGKGVQMIDLIKQSQPKTKVLIFSAHPEELFAVKYLRAGADGYLNKMTSEEELTQAFKEMLSNGRYISKNTQFLLDKADLNPTLSNPFSSLSAREMEIAKLLVKGEGNLEIANKLELQNSTVSTYKNRIFEKLSIKNTVALANMFETYGAF
jgi:DNA-binding NarL/FixJ family response regulator